MLKGIDFDALSRSFRDAAESATTAAGFVQAINPMLVCSKTRTYGRSFQTESGATRTSRPIVPTTTTGPF
ncbi:MAG: hypothetical protein R3C10_02290 [Pirellulales bacterium]